jgi:hypothetical protein
MKIKIIVKDEVGRQVNPYLGSSQSASFLHANFEEMVRSYPAPGIKDGEHEAELINLPIPSGFNPEYEEWQKSWRIYC